MACTRQVRQPLDTPAGVMAQGLQGWPMREEEGGGQSLGVGTPRRQCPHMCHVGRPALGSRGKMDRMNAV